MFELNRRLAAHYALERDNIGVIIRKAANQSVSHLHIHITRRYFGDMTEARRVFEGYSGNEVGIDSKFSVHSRSTRGLPAIMRFGSGIMCERIGIDGVRIKWVPG